jgi:hypothetical protein
MVCTISVSFSEHCGLSYPHLANLVKVVHTLAGLYMYVRFHVCREDRLWLTPGIDGNISLPLISNGKCTREGDHGNGRILRISPQGR